MKLVVNQIVSIRREIERFPKVSSFLHSMGRNSTSSERAYLNGLVSFQYFLLQDDKLNSYSVDSIILPLSGEEINIYELLDNFVSFLASQKLSVPTIKLYMTAVRSYFAYHDIDIVTPKFKRKVKMPKAYREDEEALDVQDIRNILLVCNNRRLKAYILLLASGGFRAVEALAIRLKDTEFVVQAAAVVHKYCSINTEETIWHPVGRRQVTRFWSAWLSYLFFIISYAHTK